MKDKSLLENAAHKVTDQWVNVGLTSNGGYCTVPQDMPCHAIPHGELASARALVTRESRPHEGRITRQALFSRGSVRREGGCGLANMGGWPCVAALGSETCMEAVCDGREDSGPLD